MEASLCLINNVMKMTKTALTHSFAKGSCVCYPCKVSFGFIAQLG
jgi:hypothetical protein